MSVERQAEPSDSALLDEWRGGALDAGERLFRRHYDAVERFFLNKVAVEHVGDLVQESFVACVEGRDRVSDGARFRGYLLTIAYRVFCRYLRGKYRSEAMLDLDEISVAEVATSPSSVVARAQEQRLLLEGLRLIPGPHGDGPQPAPASARRLVRRDGHGRALPRSAREHADAAR